jgi:hypothetical protein
MKETEKAFSPPPPQDDSGETEKFVPSLPRKQAPASSIVPKPKELSPPTKGRITFRGPMRQRQSDSPAAPQA